MLIRYTVRKSGRGFKLREQKTQKEVSIFDVRMLPEIEIIVPRLWERDTVRKLRAHLFGVKVHFLDRNTLKPIKEI